MERINEAKMKSRQPSTEEMRLKECRDNIPWKKWGPYLSERQWGTVREDYSKDGDAWNYFTHDHARSRAYSWGEDGIAAISDEKQRICFALAFWNEKDPILKERLFGLTNSEGNHGEDVKEYYYYLDNTPTHSYMKELYKYPQNAYPYSDLVEKNQKKSRNDMEYELLDTGIFNENKYFDIFVEYAKESPEDILIKISCYNRGPEMAIIHILPTLWFRNNWSSSLEKPLKKPILKQLSSPQNGVDKISVIEITHQELGRYFLYCEGKIPLLFTENETNNKRLFNSTNNAPFVKDGINNYLVKGEQKAVNPEKIGTKVSAHYKCKIDKNKMAEIGLRLTKVPPINQYNPFGKDFNEIFRARIDEANEFYKSIISPSLDEEKSKVVRQALAGMLWSKQYYFFDADSWLQKHEANPLKNAKHYFRNRDWYHMINDDIISMPDKWEYPWYAAWDLAFHAIPLSIVDPDFAKDQIDLILRSFYLHPSGQLPAYEWNFSDVNPPVHAWATLFLYRRERAIKGTFDIDFLKTTFNKLLLNFTWWVNRKDRVGKNVFEGGFLGLDNIGVFDRSAPLPTGGYLEQADGTAWMALFCQNMVELSAELAAHDKSYEDMVTKFVEHFLWIAAAINQPTDTGMWDEEDGFYYDLLKLPDGKSERLKVRSIVGLLPLCAITIIEEEQKKLAPHATQYFQKRTMQMPELLKNIHATGPGHLGVANRGIFALVNEQRLRRILTRMLDEKEFFSPYGIRSLSRYHLDHPYIFNTQGKEYRVSYLPAESNSDLFGGNSNWRGPIWMPINVFILRALLSYYLYYGDNFKIECPTGSGKMMNLFDVSKEIANRLTNIFLKNEKGKRPVYGGSEKFQTDPYWNDHILFYEYFHGDNGAGIGASHQTGWTGLIATIIQLYGNLDAKILLLKGKNELFSPKEEKGSQKK